MDYSNRQWRHAGSYPDDLADAEAKRVEDRRRLLADPPAANAQEGAGDAASESYFQNSEDAGDCPRVGLALSGGGIRSATFGLGVLQAMANAGLIRRIDYLSTVSGGGYIGSFFAGLFARKNQDWRTVTDALRSDHGRQSKAIDWLRQNGRYLAPNGGSDILSAIATGVRGWAAVLMVICLSFLALFLALQLLRIGFEMLDARSGSGISPQDLWNRFVPEGLQDPLSAEYDLIWASPLLQLLVPIVLVLVLPLAWAYWMIAKKAAGLRGYLAHPYAGLAVLAAAACLARQTAEAGSATVAAMIFFHVVVVLTFVFSVIARFRCLGFLAQLAILSVVLYILHESGVGPVVLSLIGALGLLLPWHCRWVTRPKLLDANAARRQLTEWLAISLAGLAFLAALGVVDSLGQLLYMLTHEDGAIFLAAVASASASAILLSQRMSLIRKLLASFLGDGSFSIPSGLLIWLIASIAGLGLLVMVNTASHALAWSFERPLEAVQQVATASAGSSAAHTRADSGDEAEVRPWLLHGRQLTERSTAAGWKVPAAAGALLLTMSWLIGGVWSFVNRSSHHSLYAARLKRTYLGASNPDRQHPDSVPVTEPLPDDDFSMDQYWSPGAHAGGAPLHLINVTINQTVSRRQGTVNRDRKGIPMAVGPSGISAGISHHYLFKPVNGSHRPGGAPAGDYWMFDDNAAHEVDRGAAGWGGKIRKWAATAGSAVFKRIAPREELKKLSIGEWVAISGAAFSTGTGYHTTVATSLLTGLANVRLGYWWRSGSKPKKLAQENIGRAISRGLRRIFPVQIHLLDELLARFHGSGEPYWYLSDGGHFENMGAYELIRRRLPVIVVVDGEADPSYQYEGLASLVRKARTDFGAEIEFLSGGELDRLFGLPSEEAMKDPATLALRASFGTLRQLVPEPQYKFSEAHAAIARVRYHGDPDRHSVLLYLKPTLKEDSPADVREYQQRNAPFPQQPTLDQFFDEVQWESYRRLGIYVGEKVFSDSPRAAWTPRKLRLPTAQALSIPMVATAKA